MPGRAKVRWVEEDRGYKTPCWIWQLARRRTPMDPRNVKVYERSEG